ncbi:MAG: hypothetical protein AB7I12_03735 [Steroidobacteraceae bacterium]
MPRWFAWTLLVALLATRVGGAHLHLCFDGQEPPASVQLGHPDLDVFHQSHEDKDINLFGNVLIKNVGSTFDLPFLLAAAVLLFVVGALKGANYSRNLDRTNIPSSFGLYLRPPLRGPPR